jgi:hypothetical protein
MTTISTPAGPAYVMHRLALAVEAIDAPTQRLAAEPLRAGREVDPRRGGEPAWPCRDLARSGTGRFRLNRAPDVPDSVRLRLDDPTRRYVPRRFDLTLWPPAATDGIDDTPPTGVFVPATSRLLRPWLLPGSAYQPPRGTTAIRGRVVRNGKVVRWPRIRAFVAANVLVGWAHGDERGEFLLVITDTATPPPVDDAIAITLNVVAAPPPASSPDPDDRLADLVVEAAPRSAAPPNPGDLDNPLLRGNADPPGYRPSAAGGMAVTVLSGELLTLASDITFTDP